MRYAYSIPMVNISDRGQLANPDQIVCVAFSNVQVTRTGIQSRTGSNFGQIEPLPSELIALERPKISHRLIMGKWCFQASTFIFIGSSSNVLVTRTGIKSRTSSNSGRIGSVIFDFGPLSDKHIQLLVYLHFQTGLSQILCIASMGWGKGCLRLWGRLDKNCGCHGNQILPLTFDGENAIFTFSQSF